MLKTRDIGKKQRNIKFLHIVRMNLKKFKKLKFLFMHSMSWLKNSIKKIWNYKSKKKKPYSRLSSQN